MMPPTSIDGTDITGATIDGTEVQEITVDGDTVFTAVPPTAPVNRMYVADFINGLVRQYDLTNKFDLTGATQTGSLSTSEPMDVNIADSGNRLVVSDRSLNRHEMYSLSTPYDVDSAGIVTSTLGETDAHGIDIDPSGVNVITGNINSSEFRYYTLGTPFDFNTATLQDSEGVGDGTYDIDYVKQGEYVYGTTKFQAYRWELTTPFDFTTRTNIQTYSIETEYRGIHVTNDGSKYLAAYYADGEVYEYNLSTPYDITSRGNAVDTFNAPNSIGLDLV